MWVSQIYSKPFRVFDWGLFSSTLAQTKQPSYKGIILTGGGEQLSGGRTNYIWEGTWQITRKAHHALSGQSFITHKEIKFLTAGDTQIELDANQKLDDLERV